MFEPHNIGKQPTDTHAKVLEEILIAVTKCNDGGRIVESIGGNDYKVTNSEPVEPGSLIVDPHEKDKQGRDIKDERGNKVLMTSTEEGGVKHLAPLEEKKIVHQD